MKCHIFEIVIENFRFLTKFFQPFSPGTIAARSIRNLKLCIPGISRNVVLGHRISNFSRESWISCRDQLFWISYLEFKMFFSFLTHPSFYQVLADDTTMTHSLGIVYLTYECYLAPCYLIALLSPGIWPFTCVFITFPLIFGENIWDRWNGNPAGVREYPLAVKNFRRHSIISSVELQTFLARFPNLEAPTFFYYTNVSLLSYLPRKNYLPSRKDIIGHQIKRHFRQTNFRACHYEMLPSLINLRLNILELFQNHCPIAS